MMTGIETELNTIEESKNRLQSSRNGSLSSINSFLKAVEAISVKQTELKVREEDLETLMGLPVFSREYVNNLFSNPNNLLKDLLEYHRIIGTVDKLKELEQAQKFEGNNILRLTTEESLKQPTFRAIQATIGLVNKDFNSLMSLRAEQLITLIKPVSQLKEVKTAFLSQYASVQRVRIKDAITDYQISVKEDDPSHYYGLVIETLLMFAHHDLAVLNGIFGLKLNKDLLDMLNLVYSEQLTDLMTKMKKSASQLKGTVEFRVIANLMSRSITSANAIQELVTTITGYLSGDSEVSPMKSPEFVSRFKESVTAAEGIAENMLDTYQDQLEKWKPEQMGPSHWESLKHDLESLHSLYALSKVNSSCSSFAASADAMFLGFRPFTHFCLKVRSEKKSIPLLLGTVQIAEKLKDIVNKTHLKRHGTVMSERLIRLSKELLESLLVAIQNRSSEWLSTSKADPTAGIYKWTGLLSILKSQNPHDFIIRRLQSLLPPEEFAAFLSKHMKQLEQQLQSGKFGSTMKEESEQQEYKLNRDRYLTFWETPSRTGSSS